MRAASRGRQRRRRRDVWCRHRRPAPRRRAVLVVGALLTTRTVAGMASDVVEAEEMMDELEANAMD